ncbi:hypothetical protein PoB_006752400 [Plakobranchus ocellatus]|uniref:Uncharacterized protein n=1 Tax=Plakobranchus ocellatus TaxID=259542 RepID=A0AAV4D9W9_9GAST|nr:hypothetical protein PoB_006752400 [Plakobranchus ocellatus]
MSEQILVPSNYGETIHAMKSNLGPIASKMMEHEMGSATAAIRPGRRGRAPTRTCKFKLEPTTSYSNPELQLEKPEVDLEFEEEKELEGDWLSEPKYLEGRILFTAIFKC